MCGRKGGEQDLVPINVQAFGGLQVRVEANKNLYGPSININLYGHSQRYRYMHGTYLISDLSPPLGSP